MEQRNRLSLSNATLRGRIRTPRSGGHTHTPYFRGGVSDVHVQPMPSRPTSHSHSIEGMHAKTDVPVNQNSSPHLSGAIDGIQPPRATIVKSRHLTTVRNIKNTQPHLPKQQRTVVLKRTSIRPLTTPVLNTRHRLLSVSSLLTGMALLLFLSGVLVVFATLRTNHSVTAQVKALSQQSTQSDIGITSGVPSEADPPSPPSSYKVAADLPRLITIDKIGVKAIIRRVGIGANNTLNAPASIFDAGWYDGSAKPGENGTVVIDGHVSGPTKHGVFYSIGSLAAGDKIKLERGDGKVFVYTVKETKTYDSDKVDMSKVLTSSQPGKAALNFMTCSGRFNVRTNQFEQRTVVYTVQD